MCVSSIAEAFPSLKPYIVPLLLCVHNHLYLIFLPLIAECRAILTFGVLKAEICVLGPGVNIHLCDSC